MHQNIDSASNALRSPARRNARSDDIKKSGHRTLRGINRVVGYPGGRQSFGRPSKPTPYHGVISPSPPAPRASADRRKTRCFVIGASVLTSTWSGLSWAALGCSWSLLWVLSGSLWVLLGAAWAPGGPLKLQLGALRVSLRTPKRFQNHLWIENDDFSKTELPPP